MDSSVIQGGPWLPLSVSVYDDNNDGWNKVLPDEMAIFD